MTKAERVKYHPKSDGLPEKRQVYAHYNTLTLVAAHDNRERRKPFAKKCQFIGQCGLKSRDSGKH